MRINEKLLGKVRKIKPGMRLEIEFGIADVTEVHNNRIWFNHDGMPFCLTMLAIYLLVHEGKMKILPKVKKNNHPVLNLLTLEEQLKLKSRERKKIVRDFTEPKSHRRCSVCRYDRTFSGACCPKCAKLGYELDHKTGKVRRAA